MHLEDADLVGCAKAVFHTAQQSVGMIALPLEIENRVRDMFKRLWSRHCALFSDMSNDEDRREGVLCELHQLHRAFTHLADTAGCRGDAAAESGLNRIDDHQCRLEAARGLDNDVKFNRSK